MTAVLHTHSRRLDYHPHIHLVVPGGVPEPATQAMEEIAWQVFALARVFRARVLESIKAAGVTLPDAVPAQWVTGCGEGW